MYSAVELSPGAPELCTATAALHLYRSLVGIYPLHIVDRAAAWLSFLAPWYMILEGDLLLIVEAVLTCEQQMGWRGGETPLAILFFFLREKRDGSRGVFD